MKINTCFETFKAGCIAF